MARQRNRLTVRKIAALKKPGRHPDGQNLYLAVAKAGTKHWTFLYIIASRQREAGLGAWPDVSLAQAREKGIDIVVKPASYRSVRGPTCIGCI